MRISDYVLMVALLGFASSLMSARKVDYEFRENEVVVFDEAKNIVARRPILFEDKGGRYSYQELLNFEQRLKDFAINKEGIYIVSRSKRYLAIPNHDGRGLFYFRSETTICIEEGKEADGLDGSIFPEKPILDDSRIEYINSEGQVVFAHDGDYGSAYATENMKAFYLTGVDQASLFYSGEMKFLFRNLPLGVAFTQSGKHAVVFFNKERQVSFDIYNLETGKVILKEQVLEIALEDVPALNAQLADDLKSYSFESSLPGLTKTIKTVELK